MDALVFWTLMIAITTAVACSLCGVYLVVKHESMVAEALSHAVLPGIIVAFIVFQDRSSPWLIISAGLSGLLMVWLVQTIRNTGLVDGDAALGIVFSALFSLGIIAASQNLNNTHFHAHCIIDGNLASAALQTTEAFGIEVPRALLVMLAVLMALLVFVGFFYKEMKLTIFDAELSRSFGFRPTLLHLGWLALVSVTTVAAFETVGSILVVALMIAPPAASFLLGRRLWQMLVVSSLIGIGSSLIGFYVGYSLDISPTGPIATAAGLCFLVTVVFAPRHGVLAKARLRQRQRSDLFQNLLLTRLKRDSPVAVALEELNASVTWSEKQFRRALRQCDDKGWIKQNAATVTLTDAGVQCAEQLS